MNADRPLPPHLQSLFDAACEETLTEAQTLELVEALRGDEQLRRRFYRYCCLHVQLHFALRGKRAESIFPFAFQENSAAPVLGFLGDLHRGAAAFVGNHIWLTLFLAFSILGASLFGVATWLMPARESPLIATLNEVQACRWAEGGSQSSAGSLPLRTGHVLDLESGMAEVVYYNGAKVLIEGPLKFELRGESEGFLHAGRLTARADTLSSRGFAISTSAARFVDRGTEFGVAVDGQGRASVAVFAGAVDAEAKIAAGRWTAPVKIVEGEALACEGSKFVERAFNRHDYPTLQQPPPPALVQPTEQPMAPQPPMPPPTLATFQRWTAFSKTLRNRPDLAAYYDFQADPSDSKALVNRAASGPALNGVIEGATWIKGRFEGKDALEFKRTVAGVHVNLPDEMQSVTVAAWINIDSLPHTYNGLLMSDGSKRTGQFHWQLAKWGGVGAGMINPIGSGLKTVNQSHITKWNIPPDRYRRWIMLAMVCNAAANQYVCYCDGTAVEYLEFVQRKPFKIGPATIGNWNHLGEAQNDLRVFDGRMDELMIFNAALSPQEIQWIYEEGKP
ncbi:MAG: FecR domain-containing protein [Pirellulales bacterium]|nr:FecR domain-containing protein [Pirellulales bacterium]